MKRIPPLTFGCVLLAVSHAFCWGQNDPKPVEATLCDLYQHPEQYTSKMVKVRGTVAGNDLWIDSFTEKACPAFMRVIVVFPNRVRPAPGFDLIKDESFKEFEDALYHPRPIHIEATFEGRFESVVTVQDGKRIRAGKGYGKKHDYDGQIVLQRVFDVVAKPLPRK